MTSDTYNTIGFALEFRLRCSPWIHERRKTKVGKKKRESNYMISQEVRYKMKHEVQEAPVYQVFTFLAEIFFCYHDACFQVFTKVHFYFISIFLYFYLFDFFGIFEIFDFFVFFNFSIFLEFLEFFHFF